MLAPCTAARTPPGPGLRARLAGPAHVSDRRGWRRVEVGTEDWRLPALRTTREETRRLDRPGPIYSRELQDGGKGERQPQVATTFRALCPSGRGIQAICRAVDGAGSGEQRTRTRPIGKWFRSLARVGEGGSALRSSFLVPEKQVQGGAAEPGPSGAEMPGCTSSQCAILSLLHEPSHFPPPRQHLF